jgi:phosphoribosylformylglycinamidine synthase subunit PurL
MGAAGLTCSTCEMGGRGGVGLEIELDLVPQRETGMTPYEIMLSESQERMLLVAEKGREDEVFRVFQKWGLDAVTSAALPENTMRVLEHGNVVAEIPNAGADRRRAALSPAAGALGAAGAARNAGGRLKLGEKADFTDELKRLLASPNICSKRWVFEQYDRWCRPTRSRGRAAKAA